MRSFQEYLREAVAAVTDEPPDPNEENPAAKWTVINRKPEPEDHWNGQTPQQLQAYHTFAFGDSPEIPGYKYKAKKGYFKIKGSMGIPRAEMPQAKSRQDLLRWLSENGVHLQLTMVNLFDKRITAAQEMVWRAKVEKFVRRGKGLEKPIILSRDYVVFDGNHHLAALRLMAAQGMIDKTQPIPMYVADMDFKPLKKLVINKYPNVTFEEWFRWEEIETALQESLS